MPPDVMVFGVSTPGKSANVADHMTNAELTQAARRLHGAAAKQEWVRVHLSDGRDVEVHPDDICELKKRDPKAVVLAANLHSPL